MPPRLRPTRLEYVVDGERLRAQLSAAALDAIGNEGRTAPPRHRGAQGGPVSRADDRQGAAGGRRRRHRDGHPALGRHRRGGHRALRLHHRAHVPRAQPHRGRAHGADGGGRLRPRGAGALLRHRPSVPAPLQAHRPHRERDRVHALRPVGPGLQGGPRLAHRRGVHQAFPRGLHHPHLDPGGAAAVRRRASGRGPQAPLPRRGGQGHGGRVRGRQAEGAGRPPCQGGGLALCGRAQRQGGQGRPSRPAHPVLDRPVHPSRRAEGRGGGAGHVRQARGAPVHPGLRLPVGRALPPALRHRPARGAADLRPAARDRPAHGLWRPGRHALGGAVHAPLLPDRQGSGRPDAGLLRQARGGGEQEEVARPVAPAHTRAAPRASRSTCRASTRKAGA